MCACFFCRIFSANCGFCVIRCKKTVKFRDDRKRTAKNAAKNFNSFLKPKKLKNAKTPDAEKPSASGDFLSMYIQGDYRTTAQKQGELQGNCTETRRGNCKAAGGCTAEAVCVKGTVQKLPTMRGELHSRVTFMPESCAITLDIVCLCLSSACPLKCVRLTHTAFLFF